MPYYFNPLIKEQFDYYEDSYIPVDATNVAAAGAVMEADTTTASMSFVVDEDDMASDLATKVPTQQSVKAYADGKIAKTTNITALNETGIADGEIAVFNPTNKDIRTSNVTIATTLGGDDSTVPTSAAVASAITAGGGANTALSNLASVAVNTSLISDTDNTDDLGSAAVMWRTGYFKTSVGIGTTPNVALQVGARAFTNYGGVGGYNPNLVELWAATDFSTGAAPLVIMDSTGTYDTLDIGGGILFGGHYASTSATYGEVGGGIKAQRESIVSGVDNWGLGFFTRSDNAALVETVRIANTGKVGVNTTTPMYGISCVQKGQTEEASAVLTTTAQKLSTISVQGAGQAIVVTAP